MSVVTPDGGLTALGYGLCGAAVVLLVLAAGVLTRGRGKRAFSTR